MRALVEPLAQRLEVDVEDEVPVEQVEERGDVAGASAETPQGVVVVPYGYLQPALSPLQMARAKANADVR